MTPEDMIRETDLLAITEKFRADLKGLSDDFLAKRIDADKFSKSVGSLARTAEIKINYVSDKGKQR